MYLFGYILVHAPVQWELTTSVPFGMLARSLADHAGSDGKILGSIKELNLYFEQMHDSSQLEDLPKRLLQSIVSVTFGFSDSNIHKTINALDTLYGLQDVYFDFKASCKYDYLLYHALQKLPNLKKLQLHLYSMTARGMEEMMTLAPSLSCERVFLKLYPTGANQRDFRPLVEALLSSQVKSLILDGTPFHFLSSSVDNACGVSYVHLILHPTDMPTVRLFHTLRHMVGICRIPTVKSLSIQIHFSYPVWTAIPEVAIYVPPQVLCNFIATWNHSLHSNPGIERSAIDFNISCFIDHTTLNRALRRDPEIQKQDLKRSRSLYDLSRLESDRRLYYKNCRGYDPSNSKRLCRRHSCPDLLDIQHLHNIHFLVHKFLTVSGYNKLYYAMKPPWKSPPRTLTYRKYRN